MARKTSDPHPESFLAFACFLLEHRDNAERYMPALFDPETVRERYAADDLPEWMFAEHARRSASMRSLAQDIVEEQLRMAGVPVANILVPTEQLFDLVASMVMQYRLFLDRMMTPRPIKTERVEAWEEPQWRTSRRHVVDVTLAMFVTAGRGSKSGTADILSDGIPRSRRSKLTVFNRNEVRHVIEAYEPTVSKGLHHKRWLEIQAQWLWGEAQGLIAAWNYAKSDPAFNQAALPMPWRAGIMLADGRLFSVFDEAAAALAPPGAIKAVEGELIKIAIGRFDRYAKRLMAAG